MFYDTKLSKILRLGDIVKGYISTCPTIIIPDPFTNITEQIGTIKIECPIYSVVLSPCCSNDNGIISLTPLIKIDNRIMQIPYFKEDPTRINQKVSPELAIPPYLWDKPDFQVKKQEFLAKGLSYFFFNNFVYEQNDIFNNYAINMIREDNITTNYYMIDFRNIYSLKCNMIKREIKLTPNDEPLIQSKKLELSVTTRAILREKLSYYFFRPAPEDDAILTSNS
jgi:hypothetical protein